MKHSIIIKRLCLLLMFMASTMGVWAVESVLFNSTESPKGTRVRDLKKGPVSVHFYKCYTSHSGNIYELAKGSGVLISVPEESYRIREVVMEDTEGGDDWDEGGLNRIGMYETAPGTHYNMFFQKDSGSQPDDNNIVFSSFDSGSAWIYIEGHKMSNKGQFKARRITVRYVKLAKPKFTQEQYDYYSFMGVLPYALTPKADAGGHNGKNIRYHLSNNKIATLLVGGGMQIKQPGQGTLTITYDPNNDYAKAECSTTINVRRERVTFTPHKDIPSVILTGKHYTLYGVYGLIDLQNSYSQRNFDESNPQFSVTSTRPDVLSVANRDLQFHGTSGEATITLKQEQNDYYEASSLSHTFIVLRSDQNGTVLIRNADEWRLFCKSVNEKGMTNLNAKLEADIDLGGDITMLGNRYSGTFDGQNHTLTLGWDGGDGWMAPFHTMNGATIKNLRVNGYIKSKGKGLSGLILNVYGNTTVSGCTSEVDITSGSSDGGCASAGLIQYISSDAHVSINDCLVKGTLKATTEIGTKGMAGFVYDQRGNCTFNNCLYTGTNNAAGGYTFAYKSTINNCYYLNDCGATYGTRVTIDQLKNGEVAYKLQAGRDTQMWGQTLGTDNAPLLTGNDAKRVRKVDFTYNDQVKATRYATHGKAIYGSLPTLTAKDIMGSDYNEHHYYTGISFEGFSASTTVNSDRTVRVIINKNDYYAIASKENWKEFCNIVNGGQTKLDAKMTANVNLGDEIVMAGAGDHKYSGTFDGQEHTLTLNWNSSSSRQLALFQNVNSATIKNLRTEGSINSNTYGLSGLIYSLEGVTTISGCVSNVNLTSRYSLSSGCDAAGMVHHVTSGASAEFTDCIVKGKFHATTENGKEGMGGFVYGQYGTCKMTNCLYAGENNATTRSNTFADKATLTNCYYLNACGTAQGKQVTKEQLKSGEVARLLQSNRNTQFWGQEIGKENEPLPTADKAKKVYKIDFAYKGKVKASRYANPGKAIFGGMPTFIAKDIMDSEYNEHHYYTFAFGNNFNASVLIYNDRTVDINPTEKDYYEIASKADWKEFCDIVSNGQNAVDAKMTADVDLGGDIKTIGDGVHMYSGTFDGQGHTLTLNWDAGTAHWKSPFYSVDGCTINKLRVKGSIKSDGKGHAGLIQNAYGTVTVSGCVSDVDITCGYSTDACSAAGMIQWVGGGAKVTFNDCLVKGSINAKDAGRKGMAGFVYNQNGKCTFNNCLYLGTNNATAGSNTFTYNATTNNCYYLNACGDTQGTKVTEEQLKSGEVAYLLQNKRDGNIWGQELGKDNEPQPTDIAAKHIYQVGFTYNGKVAAARYANSGKAIFGELPDEKELLGTAYDSNKVYALVFEDDFTASTTIDSDRTVVVTVIENNYFEIATKEDWAAFCKLVNNGNNKLNAKLMKDVDLETDIVMAGKENVEYSGTFDGQGYSLTVNWDASDNKLVSPFSCVKDVTIKNLRTKGQITSKRFGISGLIDDVYGTNNTISSCISEVNLTTSDNSVSSSVAGMVQSVKSNSSVTFNDCIVKGKMHSTTYEGRQGLSGFVYFQLGNCHFNNCLYIGTNNGREWADTFCDHPNTLNNCYYLNACGTAQGKQVTKDQLKNGYVAYKLQNNRTDKCYWAQQLGDMLDFYNAADKGKTNYVYYDATNKRWTCDDFRLTDGTPLSIGLDFIAAKATYNRTITTAKATVCLPYELPRNGSFDAHTLSGGNNSAVHFADAKDKLEAYKPYLIASNGAPQLDGNNIEVKAFNAAALTSPAGKYSFVGTVTGVDNATAAAANAYILQNDGLFHKVTTEHSAAMLPAYRAYIVRNDGSGAKQLSVVLDDETTGIDGMTDDAMGTDGTVYDLHGRRMADRLDDNTRRQLPAGVYIVSGRKVILK